MIKLSNSVYSVGVLNPNLRVFDIVMCTEYGTSYNSFIVKGGEKTALIETSHNTFSKLYEDNIKQVCDPSEIDYVILNHTEPDHSGALKYITTIAPNAEIFCSKAASIYLKSITNIPDLKIHDVKDGETLDLGGGKVLKFITAPFLHWPDSMFTSLEDEKVLFTCDFLGSHYCEPAMLDTRVTYPKAYADAVLNYYTAIFGPFKPYVLKGLEKVKAFDPELVCTSHGPVLTKNGKLKEVMECYEKWSQPSDDSKVKIPVFYCSAYGNTALLAEYIAKGIKNKLPDAEVSTYNIIEHDMCKLGQELNESKAFVIGSPTLNADAVPPVWILLAHIDAINNKKKHAAVFGSYGWSGEAAGLVAARLSGLKLNVFEELFKINFVPSEKDLENAVLFGEKFAETL